MKPESFEAFLSSNEKRIYNYLLRFVEVDDDAQDLVQNVFIAFYDRIKDIDEKTATAYAYRVAHNMALNWLKQQKRMVLRDPVDFQNLADKPAAAPEEDYTVLNKAIRSLPVKLSTVIHLQYYDKLSYKDISDRMGLSVKAVESLLVRAKKLLRKNILQENRDNHVSKGRQTHPALAG